MTSSMKLQRLLVSALAIAFCCPLFASTFIITTDELEADTFPAVANSIRANLEGPNSPPGLSSARKQDVERSLDRLERLIGDGAQPTDERVRGLQDRINSSLAPQIARDDGKSEVVCKRVRKVGSNIPTTECKTRREIEAEANFAKDMIDRYQPSKCVEFGC
jgi:hypothetical protein